MSTTVIIPLWGPGALRKDSQVAVGAWFIPQNKIQVKASWPTHVASSVPRTLGGFLWHRGLERKGKWIFFSFFKCKLPNPITSNWTNEVSLGLRLCHVTSYLGMLQTFWIVDCDNPEWGIFIFPSALKRQPPGLQGNRFCYLSLTALPVDYKALGKEIKRTHPPWFFWTFLPSPPWRLFRPCWGKDAWNTCTWKVEEMVQVPFAQESSPKLRHRFSSCVEECAASRQQLCRALPNPLWFYLYVFPWFIPVCHCCIGVAASDQMLQVFLWTPGQVPPHRTKPVP